MPRNMPPLIALPAIAAEWRATLAAVNLHARIADARTSMENAMRTARAASRIRPGCYADIAAAWYDVAAARAEFEDIDATALPDTHAAVAALAESVSAAADVADRADATADACIQARALTAVGLVALDVVLAPTRAATIPPRRPLGHLHGGA